MTFLLSLFLALAKRRDDVIREELGEVRTRKAIYGYNIDFLNHTISIMGSVIKQVYNRGKLFLVNAGKKAKEPFKLTNEYTVRGKKYKYEMDSAIVMIKDKLHYSCLISGNKRDYAFDGAAFSRLTPFEWKNKLNTADEFSFEGNTKKYSFAVSETYLIYYRS